MSQIVYRMSCLLCRVVWQAPLGTNLGLYYLLWTLVSGRLLTTRGAIIPALSQMGLPDDAVRRSWAALAYGQWDIQSLVDNWQKVVQEEGRWQVHRYGGYRLIVCDLVGFFRPCLQDCPSKHYLSAAGKALPAISLGVAARIGSVGAQRLALPLTLVRAEEADPREGALQARLLRWVGVMLAQDEALLTDRGFGLAQIQQEGIERYVSRGPKNFTARRAYLPEYSGQGRPAEYGEIVRPLPRTYKEKTIEATPPDRVEIWFEGQHLLRALFWDPLVLPDAKPGAPTFTCVVIHDPRYQEPLLLNTTLPLWGQALRAFYRDRWPIEQLPLCAKQMIGAARQFVFAKECRQRLPELSLLAGAILSYAAATQEAIPTGFWDRRPKPTPGRLRRALAKTHFSDLPLPAEQLRKKQSLADHLPKGIQAHRRQKRHHATKQQLPMAA